MQFYFLLAGILLVIGGILQTTIKNKRISKAVFCVLAFVVLGGLSALRYDVGNDYFYIYTPIYATLLRDPASPAAFVHEPGFYFIERATAFFFPNYQMLFVVTSILIIGLLMLYFYLHSPSPVMSVFLFLSLGQYYCTMNFIRQSLAAVICLFAIPYFQKRKFWRYLAVILFASLFHSSVLLLLVFYLVNLIPCNGYTLSIYIPVTVIFYLSSSELLVFAMQSVYSYYSPDDPSMVLGFPLGALGVTVFVFLFIFLYRKALMRLSPKNYIYINYAFFSMFFMFLGTKHAIFNRFSMLFDFAIPVAGAIIAVNLRSALPKFRELTEGIRQKSKAVCRNTLAFAVCLFVLLTGAAAANYYLLHRDFYGVVPYQLITAQPFWSKLSEGFVPGNEPTDEPV